MKHKEEWKIFDSEEMWGNDEEGTEQTHPVSIHNNPIAHVIALSLEDVKEQSDAVLCGGNQLPDAVLVWRILSGPSWTGNRAIQLRNEASTGS